MKRYQAIAFLLSTAMTVGSVAPVFGASNDVFGHWAEFTITKWQNEGRIGGYEDGTFKPDKSITRAEFVRLLNSAVPTAFTSSSSVSFSDVKESDWFFADVAKAVGSGVTSGFEDGTFRPGETVTRMQAAVFIAKAKGLAANEAAANNFTDAAQIPAWAKGAVGAAVSAGYLSGYPDGSFGGSKGMTRAEAVSTLDRVLGGTSTSTQTPSQGEIDTTDRDSQTEKEETTTTANAGDMVWTSGGSGRRSSSSSGGGSSSSSSSNTISRAVEIKSQSDADELKGKTLTGKATIYASQGLTFNDVKFKGDVDIIADSTTPVASAYIGEDVAVAADYIASIRIYFEGRTNISGMLRTIRDGRTDTQVIIVARTPKTISAIVKALIPTRIEGFEVAKVEASAPVEVAKDAKVGTITAETGASVKAEGEVNNVNVTGDVKNIELSGSGSTTVKVDDKASVEKIDVKDNTAANIKVNGSGEVGTVAVSDSANAKVNVNDTASVGKVEISDTATANVAVDEEAKVDTVTSTSTAPGSTVTGTGTVDKIESENPGTLEKDDEVQAPPVETPDKPDDSGSTDGEQNPGGDTAKPVDAEALKKLTITLPETVVADKTAVDIKGTGVTATGTWTEGTEANVYTANVELTATNGFAEGLTVDTVEAALKEAFAKEEVTVTAVDVTDIAKGKITFTVTATITGEVKPTVTLSVPEDKKTVIVSKKEDSDNAVTGTETITITAEVTNPADGATITWSLPNDIDDKIAFKDNKTSSPITDETATVELTIDKSYAIEKEETLTITGTYTPKATEEDAAPAAEAEAITGTVTIQLVPKGAEETTVKTVELSGAPAKIDLSAATPVTKYEDITATVTSVADKVMNEEAVTWTLTGATNTTETKLTGAEGSKTGTDGKAKVTLTVGEDEKGTNGKLTLTAKAGNQTAKAEIIVTPKADGGDDGDEDKVEATAPNVTEFDENGKGSTTITVTGTGADLKEISTELTTTEITFDVVENKTASDDGGSPSSQANDSGLTFTAKKATDGNKINVEVTKGKATDGTYNVTAKIQPAAFTTAPAAPVEATFDVIVGDDSGNEGSEIKSIALTGLTGLTKLEQDAVVPTISTSNEDVEALTNAVKWQEATPTIKAGEVQWQDATFEKAGTTDVFTAGKLYRAQITFTAKNDKTFAITDDNVEEAIKTDLPNTFEGAKITLEPAAQAATPETITVNIELGEAAAKELKELTIAGVPEVPTDSVSSSANGTISVPDTEKGYKVASSSEAATWKAAEVEQQEGGDAAAAKPTYELTVVLEADNEVDGVVKYKFATSGATLSFNNITSPDGYAAVTCNETTVLAGEANGDKTQIAFKLTCAATPAPENAPDNGEGQGDGTEETDDENPSNPAGGEGGGKTGE